MTEEVRVDVIIQAFLDRSRGLGGQGIRGCSCRAGRERRIARRRGHRITPANRQRCTACEAIRSAYEIADGERLSALESQQTADAPSLKYLVGENACQRDRYLVHVADAQAMTAIEVTEGAVA